ncbi:MAG: hypothetical protein HZC25_18545 [Rhodospirillales bacterium]|nr:hypothetical protein [Rhodospirillales bacterium]
MRFRTLLLALAFGLFALAAQAEGELVVIGITGDLPGLKVGQTIAPGSPIALPAATSLRLLSAAGKTITLTGPYSGPLAAPAESGSAGTDLARLAKHLTERPLATSALGTVRSAAIPHGMLREPADPWMILIHESGPQCARPPKATLWRRDARADETMFLRAESGATIKDRWPAGEHGRDLPGDLLADGQVVQAALGSRTSLVTLHLLPADQTQPVAIAAWMAEKGCRAQLERFLGALP